LFDGIPSNQDLNRLRNNTPKQESGRFLSSELTLARANKSVRLFDHVTSSLASGRQPDIDLLADVGYLMRTTAVYGSGKFGCSDRQRVADRPELASPFQAELLTVYLIRWLTIELVNHVASKRGGDKAVKLDNRYARYLGIGNSTGLGMAPFMVNHPLLIHNWVNARETALGRVRALGSIPDDESEAFQQLLNQARQFIGGWRVADEQQMAQITILQAELARLADWCHKGWTQARPWDALVRFSEENFSLEGQEFAVSLVLERQGELIDDLGAGMSAAAAPALDPSMSVSALQQLINRDYGWATKIDFSDPTAQRRFWYYSEDKLEPRLGDRQSEVGADIEMPLAIGRDVCELAAILHNYQPAGTIDTMLLQHPELRKITRRIQCVSGAPYGEIQDNLLEADIRPLDLLRFKLAFFGVGKFDPKSDLWTRVNMYQGAPGPDELADDEGGWTFPLKPEPVNDGASR
jgi:hypothetical protein